MADYSLPASELAELRAAHRGTRDKREADRIKAVILLASGWSAEDVADALLIDPNSVRNHFKRYRQGGLAGLLHLAYCGSACELSELQLAILDAHLQNELYLSAKDVAAWVEETFGVAYTVSGMTALLHRLGFVYKKPKLVPGKADRAAQETFLAQYEELKNSKGENDVILFMDAVHPQHNPVLGYGWIKRGEDREVPSNTGRRRLNINGAVDLERLEPVVRRRSVNRNIVKEHDQAFRPGTRQNIPAALLHNLGQRAILKQEGCRSWRTAASPTPKAAPSPSATPS